MVYDGIAGRRQTSSNSILSPSEKPPRRAVSDLQATSTPQPEKSGFNPCPPNVTNGHVTLSQRSTSMILDET